LDIHVKLQKTEIYRKSVIYMGTKVYKNLPKFLKEIDYYKAFNRFNAVLNPIYHLLALLEAHPILHISRIRVKKELKIFLLLQSFYSVEESVSS